MARTLDSQVSQSDYFSAPPSGPTYSAPPLGPNYGAPPLGPDYGGPPPGGQNPNPGGFAFPTPSRGNTPLPPPAGSQWSPWNVPQNPSPPHQLPPLPQASSSPRPQHSSRPSYSSPRPAPPQSNPSDSLTPAMASMSLRPAEPPRSSEPPSLTAPLPTISSLLAGLQSVQNPTASPQSRIAWCRDILALVERMYPAAEDAPPGPVHITDSELARMADIAVPMLLQLSNLQPPIAEAVYLRATLAASGAFPQFVQANPRAAFRDYEKAARAGFHTAWFKLGRDYENFGDFMHAKDCFERGVKQNNESCLYRMGMAHLLGQLGLPVNMEIAVPLLQRAATLATVEVPQPPYIFGLLLLGEFAPASLPSHLLNPSEARRHLERAAYLHFAPAQYKLGHAYEFAAAPFPFDALLSVQYYSLASQQGESEADMALSKWFLCGAEGAFDKDEALAFTFAEKAARKGLPSAEFAMGYYMEVGVGGPKDLEVARKWYTRASQHGNTDATERLAALAQSTGLSRQEHDALTNVTVVRKRTQAKQRSDARGPAQSLPSHPAAGRQQIIANVRKNSLAQRPPRNILPQPGPSESPRPAPAQPQPQPQPQPQSQPYPSGPPPPQQQGYLPGPGHPARQPSGDQRPPPQGSYGNGYTSSPRPIPQPQHTPSLPPHGSPGPGSYPQQRAPANQPRYGLNDPGASPAPGQQQTQPLRHRPRPSGGGGGSVPQPQPQGSLPTQVTVNVVDRPPPGKGPATFQEMGFQSQKLDDKECVIM
ncbi:HCP-like protein [Artomyces pyxidatus]|uniref:HCP-like protein n=1 Tax=Artomyces pyxidatus TaxID=48021 RepID=A0ACB8TES1_9AGAM|nr:HCP-like protein [Artomyces pyxidatus]